MKTDAKRLAGMREALLRLTQPVPPGEDAATAGYLVVWRAYHFRAMADLALSLSPSFRDQHAVWPWRKLTGARRLLAQDWFGLDPGLFAAAAELDAPRLLRLVDQALAEPQAAAQLSTPALK